MDDDCSISPETLSRMATAIEPAATVRSVERMEGGHSPVYRLAVDTPAGTCDWVLKASPGADSSGVATEARLLTVLDSVTSLPVPSVVGAVDRHDTLPAPFFLMESADGTDVPKRDIGRLSDAAVERLARQTGIYLAELHDVDGPEGFGRIDVDAFRPLRGERPSADVRRLTVAPLQDAPATDEGWPAVMEAWAETALNRHASTRFGDLTTEIRPVVCERLESLSGPFRPAIGRIDHGLHNLLVDADTGAIVTMLDWGFTLSVPAAYDLACVVANLSLGPWFMVKEGRNRRRLIRESVLSTYREAGRPATVNQFHAHEDLYELVALLRAMNNLSAAMPGATQAQLETAAEEYRTAIAERL